VNQLASNSRQCGAEAKNSQAHGSTIERPVKQIADSGAAQYRRAHEEKQNQAYSNFSLALRPGYCVCPAQHSAAHCYECNAHE
jgi:hypothetical protein